MKRFCLALVLIGMLSAMLANPITPIFCYRFWFLGNGDIHLELSPEVQYTPCDSLDFFDGSTHHFFSFDPYLVQFPYPLTFSNTGLSPISGSFTITNFHGEYSMSETVSWGPETTNDLSSLSGTQCAVQLRRETELGDAYSVWAKDYSPDASTYNTTLARSTTSVSCKNLQGQPIPNARVYFYGPCGYQDSGTDGCAALTDVCARTTVQVYAPGTWISVYNSTFFAEPDQSYEHNVVWDWVATEDPLAPIVPGVFSVQPNVLRNSRERLISLRYDKLLATDAVVELYNLKGQFISKTAFTGTEQFWTLPSGLGSGVYFLKLNSSDRTLGTARVTILH
ncbi:MAG: T9SS type A sorting domain-containing protein [Candidatus Cloacimonas sp.]|nr:T9SS type A sorting domain-containing protein [Candidatus Cloacimonas sp.]